ncbi:hypothetical protein TNCV_3140381 [Trichonephila clavipes]|nr:hypothetical protein TNCV_3140381 [Trichonephila clavipes]
MHFPKKVIQWKLRAGPFSAGGRQDIKMTSAFGRGWGNGSTIMSQLLLISAAVHIPAGQTRLSGRKNNALSKQQRTTRQNYECKYVYARGEFESALIDSVQSERHNDIHSRGETGFPKVFLRKSHLTTGQYCRVQ